MSFLTLTGLDIFGSMSFEPKREGATYTVAEAGKTTSTATAFGFSGASDGTNIVIGAYNAFKAFIYSYVGNAWTAVAEITNTTGRFGYKVAISGDWVAVATTPASGNGSVFLYRRVSGTWQTTPFAQIDIPVGATGSGFASSVALSGTTLVVGHRQTSTAVGGAHVYVFNGTSWARQGGMLTFAGPTRASNNQNFGADVSVDGDTLAIGGPGSTTTSGNGMVLLSKRTGSTWSAPIAIQPSTTYTDGYGYSVKVRGNQVLVGAPSGNTTEKIPGRAFLYDYTGTPTLEQIFTVKADTSELIQDTGMATTDVFGWAVDISGTANQVIVSSTNRNGGRGAVYVYEKYNDAWGPSALPAGSKVIASDATANMRFGSVAMFAQTGFISGAYGTKSFYWFK